MIWLGLAALVTGVVVIATGLGWTQGALLFCVAAVFSVLVGRALMRRTSPDVTVTANLNLPG